ncbi:MAG: AmmeMemoRadiSam system radical SAM enzyme [Spirochaetaceae bacterium]|jgi:pyruvate formate lyase activating enzyme|nr:AmmeMemoRadiSam system radical SAM enzyme [Spirochaetaceae bacterium]
MSVECGLCPHNCRIAEGKTGFCGARACLGGNIVCGNYGFVTALALDPIEKKPLARYKSGSFVLSAGSFGCNFRCPFCQNHSISMLRPAGCEEAAAGPFSHITRLSPEMLAAKAAAAVPAGNIGIAFTYNEPLVGFEFIYDTAVQIKNRRLDNVLVSNGCINPRRFETLLPLIDAANIDLKTFNASLYQKISGMPGEAALETIKTNITRAATRCHLELTCLVIPDENDSAEEMERMSAFIAAISPEIPLHLSRFFPRHLYAGKSPTPLSTLKKLKAIAAAKLRSVVLGNC